MLRSKSFVLPRIFTLTSWEFFLFCYFLGVNAVLGAVVVLVFTKLDSKIGFQLPLLQLWLGYRLTYDLSTVTFTFVGRRNHH